MKNNTSKPFYNTTIPSDWEVKTVALEEEQLLVEVAREITDAFKLSELFKRQPSAIKNRLKDRFKIII